MTTVVPRPTAESMENSSTRRRLPGSPSPRLSPVVYPSRMTCSTSAIPGSAVSAVRTRLIGTPSATSVMATASWIPALVDRAPSRRTTATSRAITRATNESTMDSPLTSMSSPVARVRATSWLAARSMCSTVVSSRLPCRVTIRFGPSRRIGMSSDIDRFPFRRCAADDLQGELQRVPQAVAAAQGTQLDAQVHDRLGGLRAYPAQHARRTHEPGGLHGLEQVLGDVGVDRRYPADVQDHHLGLVARDTFEQAVGEPGGAQAVQRADDRQHQYLVPHLDHRRRQFQDLVALPLDELLLFAPLAQVPGHLDVPEQLAGAVPDGAQGDVRPEPAAVLAEPPALRLEPALPFRRRQPSRSHRPVPRAMRRSCSTRPLAASSGG